MIRCQKLKQKQIYQLQTIIKTSKKTDEVKRAQTILLLNQENDIKQISALTGYQRRQIFSLRKSYLEKGIDSLTDKRKGEPKELLTKKQRQEIIEVIKTKTPKDLGYFWEFWTSSILTDYIEQKYSVRYKSKTSLYIIFRKSEFTYHKPGRKYHLRDEQEVLKFRKKTKTTLKKHWPDPNTVILTEDEMVLSTQTTFQKIWLPKNESPKIEISNNRKNRSIYGFLNIKTGAEHAFKTEYQNMYITAKILKKMRKIYPGKRLLIFWDGAGWHRGSVAQTAIQRDKNIIISYLPKYSPEENPQEHVWKDGRKIVTHNRFIEDIDIATDDFVKYLNETKFCYNFLGFSAR